MYEAVFDFGKYRGRPVSEAPDGYLRWCLRDCQCLGHELRQAIEDELRRRAGRAHATGDEAGQRPGAGPPANWSSLMAAWYRQLCRDYHPDRGGSTEAMQAINDAHERLRRLTGV